MKIGYKLIFIILFSFMMLAPKTVLASNKLVSSERHIMVQESDVDCVTLLGEEDDDKSVMWLIMHFFAYAKIIVPMLTVVFSAVDFISSLLSGSDDKMKKAYKKLGTRLVIAIAFFLVPSLVKIIFSLFGFSENGVCINF